MKINWLKIQMTSTFSSINDYFTAIDGNQENIIQQETKRISEDLDRSDEWDDEVQKPDEEQISLNLADSIEEIKTRSLIVYLNDRVEYYLGRLCKAIQKETSDNISFSDFYGTPIEKTNKYLRHLKRPEIEIIDNNLLSEIQIIRNCIVHCNGIIDESRDKNELRRIITRNEGVSSRSGELHLSSGYLKDKIDMVTRIMQKIYEVNGWGEFKKE